VSNISEMLVQTVLSTEVEATVPAFAQAKKAFLDYLAASFAAVGEISVKNLEIYIGEQGNSLLIGCNKTTSAEKSALYNGFLAHYLDYDDTSSVIRGHGSAVLYSSLLALSRRINSTPQRFLAAYVIGMELMGRLAIAVGNQHYNKGFHNTATLGVVAGCLANCYYLDLDKEKTLSALGIAVSLVSGARVNFGTEAKPLQVGLAAEKSIESVLLAGIGMKASTTALDGDLGFFTLYGTGPEGTQEILTADWGERWHIIDQGLWFKRYTFCSGALQVADAAQSIKQKYSLQAEQIKKVEIVFNSKGDAALVQHRPTTGEEGRFSAEYVCAVGLLDRLETADNFSPQLIKPFLKKFLLKVKRVYTEDIKSSTLAQPKGRLAIVRVYLDNGDCLEERIDVPKGAPRNPLTKKDIEEKFLRYYPGLQGEDVISLVYELESQQNMEKLLELLATK